MCSAVLKKAKEQKVKSSPEQKSDSIIRQIKINVTHMKTTTTNIPPSHPLKKQTTPPSLRIP